MVGWDKKEWDVNLKEQILYGRDASRADISPVLGVVLKPVRLFLVYIPKMGFIESINFETKPDNTFTNL